MIKKVFVGVLLAGVFGLLVFGAVNRTLAKNDDSAAPKSEQALVGNNREGGNANSSDRLYKNQTNDETNGAGSGSRSAAETENESALRKNATSNDNNSGNLNGTGQGGPSEDAPADGAGTGLAEVDEWITQTGTVESVDDELLVVNLTDGTTLEIEGRTLSYALELGLSVKAGGELVLTGFMEEDEFEVGQIENITTGEIVVVRAENGRPLWAGGWH